MIPHLWNPPNGQGISTVDGCLPLTIALFECGVASACAGAVAVTAATGSTGRLALTTVLRM